ncbi:hypothetical protein [Pseudomonas sp. R151218B TE3479]
MTTLSKRELIDRSIEGIFALLYEIARTPASYVGNEQILEALKSQGNLCTLDMESEIQGKPLRIQPISLNTLKKRLSDNGPDRDFALLDKLRVHAQQAILGVNDKQAEPKKRSLKGLEDQIADLEASVASLHAVNMVLVQALEVNRRDLISLLSMTNVGLRQSKTQKAIDRIIKILSINPAPFDDVTILSMQKHLQVVPNGKTNR